MTLQLLLPQKSHATAETPGLAASRRRHNIRLRLGGCHGQPGAALLQRRTTALLTAAPSRVGLRAG
jgi:hypothetical protein